MQSVDLKLLGNFQLSVAEPVTLPTRKAEALLAYLATSSGLAHQRDKLVSLLWGERGDAQARHSLAQAILVIRKALGNDARGALVSSGQSVFVEPSCVAVDVGLFETLAAKQTPDAEIAAMELYRGTFLDGIYVREQAFEDWLRGERDRLNSIACDTLERILERRVAAGDDEPAIEAARKLFELDPFREPAHRSLMRLHQRAGHDTAAIRQYQICAEILRDELGIEPDAETRALRDEILGGRSSPGDRSRWALRSAGHAPQGFVLGRPVIAVLPFSDFCGDPAPHSFRGGIAEDIISGLSKVSDFSVISLHSVSPDERDARGIKRMADELGVRYVVSGALRRVGDAVRVNAQLIDGESGSHLWAERYDGSLDDVFDLHDLITEQIVVAVETEIAIRERERARRKPPDSLDAWELLQRGLSHFYHINKTDRTEAIRLFREAVALEPEFASAHAHLAYALWASRSVTLDFIEDTEEAAASARAAAEQALSLDPSELMARFALGRLHIYSGEVEMAINEMRTAIAINPNFSRGYHGLGQAYYYGAGRFEKALPYLDTALRLSPRSPMRWTTLMIKGTALRSLGHHDEAIAHCRQACQFPDAGFLPFMQLAAALAEAGQKGNARAAIKKTMQLQPALSIGFVRGHFAGMHEYSLKSLLDSLRKTGVPE